MATPVGGKQTRGGDDSSVFAKVEVGCMSSCLVVGTLLQTLFANRQWGKRWSAVSGSPHRAQVTGCVMIPLLCKAMPKGK